MVASQKREKDVDGVKKEWMEIRTIAPLNLRELRLV